MITMGEAAQATGGSWLVRPPAEHLPLLGGAFDTRDVGGAQIFFALAGQDNNGHRYLDQLQGSTVRLAVVGRDVSAPPADCAVLRTGNTLEALAGMASFMVAKYGPKVVAVTGSYGKTTTKEVIATVLSGRRKVLKSPGSLNNEIGIPISLLSLDGSQQMAVLEFSARKAGDIDTLGRIAAPDVAVLLSVGHAHVGVFGSLEAVYRAKGEIFAHLRTGGLALVGAADPRLRQLAGEHRTLTFGRDGGDFRAESIALDKQGRQYFTGVHQETRLALRSGMIGPRGCEPVLAAWAVARELGLPDSVVENLGGADPGQPGRLRVSATPGGGVVIDDTYNASPETVIHLIETLNARPEGVKVLVLGSMAELEEGLADSAGRIAEALTPPLSRCIVYDPNSSLLFDRLREHRGPVPLERIADQAGLIEALKAHDAPDAVVGIKGARSAHMERAVLALLGTRVHCERNPCSLLRYCGKCDELTGT